jgi:hypothetical protein
MPVINWNVILSGLLFAALTGIFNLILGHKSQVEAWAESNPKLAAILKFTRALGFDPWNLIAAISLIVQKKLPEAQKSDSVIAQTEQKKADAKLDADETVRVVPAGPLLVLLFVCSLPTLHGCAGHQVAWPKVLSCADSLEVPLLTEVERVLAGTGDVKTDLEALAGTYAPSLIECAVQQIVGDLSAAPVTARASHASARGRDFLAKVQQ